MNKTPGQRLAELRRKKEAVAREARLRRIRAEVARATNPAANRQTDAAIAPMSHESKATTDNTLYSELSDHEFIVRQFVDFCGRSPSPAEFNVHLQSLASTSRLQKNDQFAYCDEVVKRTLAYRGSGPWAKLNYTTSLPPKTAVLLTGHLRTFQRTYPSIREKLVLPMSADVFVHTWDKLGMQRHDHIYGPIPDDSVAVDASEIRRLIPETAAVSIENNAEFIARAKTRSEYPYVFGAGSGNSWKMLSAKPVFIESQLYSISSAFKMMQEHEIKNGFKYDLIVKLRSDLDITEFSPDLTELSPSGLWIPNYPENNHAHPVCFACERGPHEGRHATDVCDVYSYGGRDAMGHYCSLWDNLESVYERMSKENSENIRHPHAVHGMRDGHVVVPIWKNGPTHRLHCFYPERLFRMHLEGFHLKKGRMACRIIR